MAPANYRIISCDGGGIRGLLTALILQQIQIDCPTVLNGVALYAGTSTGGLIALALAANIPIATIVGLYSGSGNCNQIFTKNTGNVVTCSNAVGQEFTNYFGLSFAEQVALDGGLGILGTYDEGIFEASCQNSGLKALLTKTFPKNPTLASLTNRVLVTTLQLASSTTRWAPLLLHNLPNLPQPLTSASTIIDAALSTSAAPTYFPPYNHPLFKFCVDGGMVANNPAPVALAAFCESQGVALNSVRLLSLGTGLSPAAIPPTSPICTGCAGTWQWIDPLAASPTPATPILTAAMDNASAINDMMAGMLLQSNTYRRINPILNQVVNLDDCTAVPALVQAAKQYIGSTAYTADKHWIQTNFL